MNLQEKRQETYNSSSIVKFKKAAGERVSSSFLYKNLRKKK